MPTRPAELGRSLRARTWKLTSRRLAPRRPRIALLPPSPELIKTVRALPLTPTSWQYALFDASSDPSWFQDRNPFRCQIVSERDLSSYRQARRSVFGTLPPAILQAQPLLRQALGPFGPARHDLSELVRQVTEWWEEIVFHGDTEISATLDLLPYKILDDVPPVLWKEKRETKAFVPPQTTLNIDDIVRSIRKSAVSPRTLTTWDITGIIRPTSIFRPSFVAGILIAWFSCAMAVPLPLAVSSWDIIPVRTGIIVTPNAFSTALLLQHFGRLDPHRFTSFSYLNLFPVTGYAAESGGPKCAPRADTLGDGKKVALPYPQSVLNLALADRMDLFKQLVQAGQPKVCVLLGQHNHLFLDRVVTATRDEATWSHWEVPVPSSNFTRDRLVDRTDSTSATDSPLVPAVRVSFVTRSTVDSGGIVFFLICHPQATNFATTKSDLALVADHVLNFVLASIQYQHNASEDTMSLQPVWAFSEHLSAVKRDAAENPNSPRARSKLLRARAQMSVGGWDCTSEPSIRTRLSASNSRNPMRNTGWMDSFHPDTLGAAW